jgi:hypothetical protein
MLLILVFLKQLMFIVQIPLMESRTRIRLADGTLSDQRVRRTVVHVNEVPTEFLVIDTKKDYEMLLGSKWIMDNKLILDFSESIPQVKKLELLDEEKEEDLPWKMEINKDVLNSELVSLKSTVDSNVRLHATEQDALKYVLTVCPDVFAENLMDLPGSNIIDGSFIQMLPDSLHQLTTF